MLRGWRGHQQRSFTKIHQINQGAAIGHSACDLGKVPRGGCSFNLRAENRQHNATCANVGTAKQGQIHANTMVGQHLNINSFESELGTWMVLSLKPTLRQNYDMTLWFQYASRVAVCLWSGPGCIGVVKA